MSEGIKRIAKERQRQIEEEGWTAEHDDEHTLGEIAWAAVCYAAPGRVRNTKRRDPWPWSPGWDKRPNYDNNADDTTAERIRNLEKAGALIAAEIDRLLRLEKDND